LEKTFGYGSALSDSATYDSATFASLGVTPGTYVWSWGTGANQNFTLVIPAAGVPDAGSTIGLLILALAALFFARRAFPVQSA
jgi:VPDSG-CTERM motif